MCADRVSKTCDLPKWGWIDTPGGTTSNEDTRLSEKLYDTERREEVAAIIRLHRSKT